MSVCDPLTLTDSPVPMTNMNYTCALLILYVGFSAAKSFLIFAKQASTQRQETCRRKQ